MKEIWKSIPGYEEYYEVSNTGKIRSITRTIIMKNGQSRTYKGEMKSLTETNQGYLRVSLYKDNKQKTFFVHRLVAMAFLPNPNNYSIINHKDENPLNNNVDNLEWCTQEYNVNYGTAIERRIQKESKPIIMCDKETHEPIQEFPSIKEAMRSLGQISDGNIHKVLRGDRNMAHGYWWKYKEDEE